MLITETQTIVLGDEVLDVALEEGATDREVLEAAAAAFPEGFRVVGPNHGPVWVHPQMILNLGQEDSFGLEFIGLGNTAAELVRLAADPLRADALGGAGCDRMIAILCSQAAAQASAKRPNQLHAHRWGASAKVVLADNVAPGTIEVHPEGNVAKKLAALFGCKPGAAGGWADLEDKDCIALRHPFIVPYRVRVVYNWSLTPNLCMANRLDCRKANQGDADGDQIFLFPVRNADLADALDEEIQALIPDVDITGWGFNKPCHEDDSSWGEIVTKSTEDKLAQSFTKSIGDWVRSHIKLGDYANRLTPFSYRISNIGACMAAAGIAGGQEMALIGALIEESFYIGLTGGPEGLDAAMDIWFNKKMSSANQTAMFRGLEEVLAPDIIYNRDVRTALARGSSINRGNFDMFDPAEAMVHFMYHVGKGSVTTRMDPLLFRSLAEKLTEPEGFAQQMVAHAAQAFLPVVGQGKDLPVIKAAQAVDDEYDNYYTSEFEEE